MKDYSCSFLRAKYYIQQQKIQLASKFQKGRWSNSAWTLEDTSIWCFKKIFIYCLLIYCFRFGLQLRDREKKGYIHTYICWFIKICLFIKLRSVYLDFQSATEMKSLKSDSTLEISQMESGATEKQKDTSELLKKLLQQ